MTDVHMRSENSVALGRQATGAAWRFIDGIYFRGSKGEPSGYLAFGSPTVNVVPASVEELT